MAYRAALLDFYDHAARGETHGEQHAAEGAPAFSIAFYEIALHLLPVTLRTFPIRAPGRPSPLI